MARTQQSKIQGKERRAFISQSDLPSYTLAEALRIPRVLVDHFAGKPTAPHDIAMAIDLSPTGSQWRMLAGCAVAYGLTTASFSADRIGLTDLGRRIVAPTSDGDDLNASVEALLKPKILREFFEKYDKNKFPRDDIAQNVLEQMGAPRDRIASYLEILIQNGRELGVIRETKTGLFVTLEPAKIGARADTRPLGGALHIEPEDAVQDQASNVVPIPREVSQAAGPLNNRVFISHGKNKKIVDQLKTVIGYGNFEPVVSVENETVSKPIPEKVLDDMRSCTFAVIHIEDEMALMDSNGDKHIYLNPNVLIEIGASLALHKDRFVLLVKDGVQLPSNLQGLYQCKYSGDTLDFDATMRLLKAFNEFRGKPKQ